MKYLFSKARYVVFRSPHCGEGLFFCSRGIARIGGEDL